MGVGKSRMLSELCVRLECAGRSVLRCHASAAARTIAFGAFADVWTEQAEHATSRVQVLRHVGDELHRRAAGRSLVVAVDNLHLLDDGSAVLVHRLAVERSATVIGTMLTGEDPPDVVSALWKDGLALRVDLQPLSANEVGRLVTAVLGGVVERRTLHRLYEASKGNPLFARELLADGLSSGSISNRHGVWSWNGSLGGGPRLAGLVEQRLSRLPERGRRALELLAVGEPVEIAVLRRLVGDDVLNLLERQGFVEVDADRRRTSVRLAHRIYGEALQTMAHTTRAELSRMLADESERTGARRVDDLLRLAQWRLDSGENLPDANWLVRGARRALARSSHVLAERLASTAVSLDPDLALARLVLAESQYWQGRFSEVESTLADAAGPDEVLAEMLIVRSSALFWGLGRLEESMNVLVVPDRSPDDGIVAELDAHRASLLLCSGDVDGAASVAAAVLARPTPSPTAYLRAVVALIAARGAQGHAQEALALADATSVKAEALADTIPQAGHEVGIGRFFAQLWAGRVDDAERFATEHFEAAVRRGSVDYLGTWAVLLGYVALARGDIENAITHLTEARGALEMHDPAALRPMALALMAQAIALSDRPEQAAEFLRVAQAAANPAATYVALDFRRAEGWVHARHGDRAAAVAALEEAVSIARQGGSIAGEAVVLHDIARLGQPVLVADRLTELAGRLEGPAAPAYAAHAVAKVAGDGAALEAVATEFERLGFWLYATEAFHGAAAVWRAAGLIGRQQSCLQRATEIGARCGRLVSPTLERPNDTTFIETLTPREVEVGRLAASGLSNREIAERLYLSMRTVGNHLNHIYAKLGLQGRDELPCVFTAVDRVC
jgi:tetratricopeptide (TPR) repeat protein